MNIIHFHNRSTKSQVYTLMFGSQTIPVYCHMGNFGCGDGGWTPVMKIDGTKVKFTLLFSSLHFRFSFALLLLWQNVFCVCVCFQSTFHYDSVLWSNKNTYNHAGGQTGFDQTQTKLPSYWSTSFSKICLGTMIHNQSNFVVINKHAGSLYSLIADGQYRTTSMGRDTWKSLLGSAASLQRNCNKEGFNTLSFFDGRAFSKARIGILGNQETTCLSCDSRIGFGTGGYLDDSKTCGNEAKHLMDNGDRSIKAMGYILVQ